MTESKICSRLWTARWGNELALIMLTDHPGMCVCGVGGDTLTRHMRTLLCVRINRKKKKKNPNTFTSLICTPACVFVCTCDVTLLSGSAISDYLGLPVGSVVPMATSLPSLSTKGSRSLYGFLPGRCESDWECRWQGSTHQDSDGVDVAREQMEGW